MNSKYKMKEIEDLPNEILLMILSYLNRPMLEESILYVNRRFRALAFTVLTHRYYLEVRSPLTRRLYEDGVQVKKLRIPAEEVAHGFDLAQRIQVPWAQCVKELTLISLNVPERELMICLMNITSLDTIILEQCSLFSSTYRQGTYNKMPNNLEVLEFVNCAFYPQAFRNIARFLKLKVFRYTEHAKQNYEPMYSLLNYSSFTIQTLELNMVSRTGVPEIFTSFQFPRLKRIQITMNEGYRYWNYFNYFRDTLRDLVLVGPSIESLDIDDNELNLKHIEINDLAILDRGTIYQLLLMTNLRRITLNTNLNLQLWSIIPIECPNVIYLDLKGGIFSGENYECLPRMFPNVEYFDISNTNFERSELSMMIRAWPNLRLLNIDGIKFTDSELLESGIENLRNLEILGLSENFLSDRATDLIKFPKLVAIHVFQDITEVGVQTLLSNCPKLEEIYPGRYNFCSELVLPENMKTKVLNTHIFMRSKFEHKVNRFMKI